MASFGDEIVALLNTDAVLVATLPGGIYVYPDTGKKGLTRLLSPKAFNEVNGLIAPCAVVLELEEDSDHQIVGQFMSAVTPIVVWIYDKAYTDTKYTVIETAYNLIYNDLHLAQIGNACQILWKSCVKYKREPDLKDAGFFRARFNVYAYR